jgi:hypothetical protein
VINWNGVLHTGACGALLAVLESPREIVICTPSRTNNRIRSPRCVASGNQTKVVKGSRQIRSVTLGKGLALRAGCYET